VDRTSQYYNHYGAIVFTAYLSVSLQALMKKDYVIISQRCLTVKAFKKLQLCYTMNWY